MDTIRAVREFLFEELSKEYDCTIGSDHQDISYVDFKHAIRINTIPPVHVKVSIRGIVDPTPVGVEGEAFNSIVVRVYAMTHSVTQSYTEPEWEHEVDLPAPNFGSLAEDVTKSVKHAMMRPQMSYSELHYND